MVFTKVPTSMEAVSIMWVNLETFYFMATAFFPIVEQPYPFSTIGSKTQQLYFP